MHQHDEKYVDLIAEEKMSAALEDQNEVWAHGWMDGIETQILADAALLTAFSALLEEHGEDHTLNVLEQMRSKILAGELSSKRQLH